MKKLLGLCCIMLLFFAVDVSAGLIDFTHFNYSGYGDRDGCDFNVDRLCSGFDGDRDWGGSDGDRLCSGFDGFRDGGGFDGCGLCCSFDRDRDRCGCRNPVPEPATMLLLGSGLIGFAGFGRKRFKK